MRRVLPVLLCALLTVSGAAEARKRDNNSLDVGEAMCRDFVQLANESSENEVGIILMWIDGYLSGLSGDTVINWNGLNQFSENLMTYCSNNPGQGLLHAAKRLGLRSNK